MTSQKTLLLNEGLCRALTVWRSCPNSAVDDTVSLRDEGLEVAVATTSSDIFPVSLLVFTTTYFPNRGG